MFKNLLKKKTNSTPESNPENNKTVKKYEYVLTDHFKGYKRFPIVIHGNKENEENNETVSDWKFPGKKLEFLESYYDNNLYIAVLIDGTKVGAIFDDEQISMIRSGKIEAVYARSEAETSLSQGAAGEIHKVRLFVKVKETE